MVTTPWGKVEAGNGGIGADPTSQLSGHYAYHIGGDAWSDPGTLGLSFNTDISELTFSYENTTAKEVLLIGASDLYPIGLPVGTGRITVKHPYGIMNGLRWVAEGPGEIRIDDLVTKPPLSSLGAG